MQRSLTPNRNRSGEGGAAPDWLGFGRCHGEALTDFNSGIGTVELTRAVSEAMVGHALCAGTEVDVYEAMNEEFAMEPGRAIQSTSVVCFGSSPMLRPAVSSCKVQAALRTLLERKL